MLGPLPRRITSGTSAGIETSARAPSRSGDADEPDRRRRQARALERGTQHLVDERGDRAQRRAAGAQNGRVQALQQLSGDVERRRSAVPRSSRRRRRSGCAARWTTRPFASVRVPISRSSGSQRRGRLDLGGERVEPAPRRAAAGRACPRPAGPLPPRRRPHSPRGPRPAAHAATQRRLRARPLPRRREAPPRPRVPRGLPARSRRGDSLHRDGPEACPTTVISTRSGAVPSTSTRPFFGITRRRSENPPAPSPNGYGDMRTCHGATGSIR